MILSTNICRPKATPTSGTAQGLHDAVTRAMNMDLPIAAWAAEEGVDQDRIRERIYAAGDSLAAEKTEAFGAETMRSVEKQILLQTIDQKWREHLLTLEHLRSVIGFRGYAQRDPLSEYKTEAFQLFENLLDGLRSEVTQKLSQIRPMTEAEQQAMIQQFLAQQTAQKAPQAPVAAEPALACRLWPLAQPLAPWRALTRPTPRPGATRAATTPAPAARASGSRTATASSDMPARAPWPGPQLTAFCRNWPRHDMIGPKRITFRSYRGPSPASYLSPGSTEDFMSSFHRFILNITLLATVIVGSYVKQEYAPLGVATAAPVTQAPTAVREATSVAQSVVFISPNS